MATLIDAGRRIGRIFDPSGARRFRARELTASLRTFPNVVIIGTMKGGTTSLFGWLSQHPEVLVSSTKEVHFFDHHRPAGKSVDWYRAHFPLFAEVEAVRRLRGRAVTLEATPSYMFDPRAPAQLFELIPNARLICLLREPAERAYSHYQHSVRKGREPLSFQAAIDAEASRTRPSPSERVLDHGKKARDYAYVGRSLYAEQLARWLALFPRRQLLAIRSEDLFQDGRAVHDQVVEWLGLDAVRLESPDVLNAGNYGSSTDFPERAELRRMFAPHNRALEQLLGQSFRWD
ncbi:MAG: sulfotransferase [Deltaproteobacteria bacterium]|nr:sulfotransferase [Deltaproteobacteria bacterium]